MIKAKTNDALLSRIWRYRHAYLLMAPFMIFFFLFTLLPVFASVVLSFTNFNMLEFPGFVGWDNYIRLFLADNIFLTAVRNTLVFAFLTGPVSYVLCFLFAWLINELSAKKRAIATTLFYAPVLSGQAFTVWLFIFSEDPYGIANGFLMKLGFIKEPIQWLIDPNYTMKILILVQLWLSLGTGFLAFIAGLQGIDRSLYEAGAIDGIKNRLHQLWYITLPSMTPQLIFGAVMQIVSSFAVADVSIRLAGFPSTDYSAETVVTHIIDYGTIRYEMGYACAMASVLFLAMYVTNKWITRLLGRLGQ